MFYICSFGILIICYWLIVACHMFIENFFLMWYVKFLLWSLFQVDFLKNYFLVGIEIMVVQFNFLIFFFFFLSKRYYKVIVFMTIYKYLIKWANNNTCEQKFQWWANNNPYSSFNCEANIVPWYKNEDWRNWPYKSIVVGFRNWQIW